MRGGIPLGRAFTITIPASGVGVDPVPISVSGQTHISASASVQVAYDPADFDSDQYSVFRMGLSNLPMMRFAPNTILWVRLDPTGGEPAVALSILTQIGEVNY